MDAILPTRAPGESRQAAKAYRLYRDMGPQRSIRKLAHMLGKSRQHLERWSTRFAWVERAQLWDDLEDQVLQRERLESVKAMAQRHAALAVVVLDKVVERLSTLTPEEVQGMTVSQLCALLRTAEGMERRARGERGTVAANHPAGAREDDPATRDGGTGLVIVRRDLSADGVLGP